MFSRRRFFATAAPAADMDLVSQASSNEAITFSVRHSLRGSATITPFHALWFLLSGCSDESGLNILFSGGSLSRAISRVRSPIRLLKGVARRTGRTNFSVDWWGPPGPSPPLGQSSESLVLKTNLVFPGVKIHWQQKYLCFGANLFHREMQAE